MNLPEQETQPASPEYREIPLTQGKVALVDAEDYEALAQFKWFAHWSPCAKTFYAERWAPNARTEHRMIRMHRQILNPPDGVETDHRDGNGLNNKRSNLREATKSQNMHNRMASVNNTSGFKGVSFSKFHQRWVAYIGFNGNKHHLGYFDTAEEAHVAYVEAAKRMHGEFANW